MCAIIAYFIRNIVTSDVNKEGEQIETSDVNKEGEQIVNVNKIALYLLYNIHEFDNGSYSGNCGETIERANIVVYI